MGGLVSALAEHAPDVAGARAGLVREGLGCAAAALTRRRHVVAPDVAPDISLREYIAEAWHVVEPATAFVPNWHIDAIADHLAAVTNGEIRRLLINIPPRHAKSLLVSVFWPTWVWTFRAASRWLFASYAQSLSTRDSLKCRRIIESPWYQDHWRSSFRLTTDQNHKTRFENDRTGYRLATSVDGSATGEGGDVLVADDPHSVRKAESDADREAKLSWFDQVWSTRLNDQQTGASVVVMQRVHHQDISGHVLEQGGWTHLCLPTEFEAKRRCVTVPLGGAEEPWQDPRVDEGELLSPKRFGPAEVADARVRLGGYGYAGQHQQRPTPRQGAIWERDWWRHWHDPKRCGHHGERLRPVTGTLLLSWDCAFKDLNSSDYVVGQVWQKSGPDHYLLDQVRRQMSFTATLAAVRAQVSKWPAARAKLVEDKANGTAVIDTLRREISGLIAIEPEGGKIARAQAVAPCIEAGNVFLPCADLAPWVHDFIEEAAAFPASANDDQVDAASQALHRMGHAPVAALPGGATHESYFNRGL